MKKILLLLVLSIMVEQGWAQTYDTVYNRSSELYYSDWYDTCAYFFEPPCHDLVRNAYCLYTRTIECDNLYNFLVVPDYTSRPLKVRGLAVMHTRDYNMLCMSSNSVLCHDTSRLPEYLFLYQKVGNDLDKLTEVRWDTATPQLLKLPRNYDTATYGFEYCYLYRVYFDTFITVDSVFYIGGTFYNNEIPDYHAYLHLPTFYVGMQSVCSQRPRYHTETRYGRIKGDKEFWTSNTIGDLWGPFFAIASDSSVLLEVRTSDSTMGQVEGSDWCLDSSLMTIRAIPRYHHRFTHWNDGDTSNPRTVLVTKDTVFTAYFEEYAKYSIDAVVSPQGAGRVQGTGRYYEGDTVVLKAVANEGYVFYRWNDATRENPRTVVSTQDVTYVAFFNQSQSIEECDNAGVAFTIVPNPARGQVTLQLPEGMLGQGELVLRDESGKELRRQQTEGGPLTLSIRDLAAGAYFVTFVTDQGSSTRKLLVE